MKIFAQVKVKAKEEKVEKIDASQFTVFVKETPEKGKANQAVVRALAKYFNKPKDNIKIIRGLKSKRKIVEVN